MVVPALGMGGNMMSLMGVRFGGAAGALTICVAGALHPAALQLALPPSTVHGLSLTHPVPPCTHALLHSRLPQVPRAHAGHEVLRGAQRGS